MNLAPHDVAQLVFEYHALVRHCAKVQARCSELARQQAAEIECLRAQSMRQRAATIVRDSALAWEREDRAALEAAIPGLSRRTLLAQRVEALLARIQELMRERLHWQRPPTMQRDIDMAALPAIAADEEMGALEESLVAADLVICQTGCLSHGAYWRVQDHCKRTGKACVLVEQLEALRIVRIRKQVSEAETVPV
ncbi:MAG: DUF2325 domain-containing protein [Giesbergeria sp.]